MDESEEAEMDKTVSFNHELSTLMFACSQPAQESNQSPFRQGAEKGLLASRSEDLWCLIAGVAKKKESLFFKGMDPDALPVSQWVSLNH